MATKSKKGFHVSDKLADEVERIIGTKHFILYAADPAFVHKGLVGSFIGRQLSPRHLLELADVMKSKAIEGDPRLEAVDLMNQLSSLVTSRKPKKSGKRNTKK